MKVEAVCTNPTCHTVRDTGSFVQLLPCEKIMPGVQAALDEDGNPVECGVCSSVVTVYGPARDEMQFAAGQVVPTDAARQVLGFESEDPLGWAHTAAGLLRRHVTGDHGSASPEIVEANKRAIREDPLSESWGIITSVYIVRNTILWVVTERDRRQTRIELPEESLGS